MKNFGVLLQYEFKKILRSKMVRVAFILVLIADMLGTAGSLIGRHYVEGVVDETYYEAFLKDSAYGHALDGRLLDEELIREMREGYSAVPMESSTPYSATREYQTYARPYSAIFHLVWNLTGIEYEKMFDWVKSGEKMDAEQLRIYHRAMLEKIWSEDRLTEGEKTFWREQEAALEWPMRYFSCYGWSELLTDAYSVNLFGLFFLALCLPGIFTQEHGRRTDQLILSSKLGHKQAYLAKICAGGTFVTMVSFIISAVVIAEGLILYGSVGFSAAIQLAVPSFCGRMSIGQAVLIAYGCIFATSLFIGMFTMVLAELLHNNAAALAVVVVILFVPNMIYISAQYRVLAQILNYFPGEFVHSAVLFGNWLVPVFGRCFYGWQVVPAVYLLLTAGCALLGWRLYDGYQVKGR